MKKFFNRSQKEIINKLMPGYKKMAKWKIALYSLFYIFIVFIFVIAIMFAWFAKDLPTPAKIASMHPTQSTKIYDRTGKILLYETGDQKRTIVTTDQISQNLKKATVSVEDDNFYEHHGFDTKGIFRAIFYRLVHKTSRVSGTSTITQQYVKNALLTSDRSLTRKFKELILSIELEFMYSKDEILTMYLNEIPYGNSTAGAEAASEMYFGKPAKDLDIAEAATLAAIPKAPTYYSPYSTHTQSLINRKNYVIDRMTETGKINKEQADQAKVEDTTTVGKDLKPRHDPILAPHFVMYVLDQVSNEYGDETIQKQGLNIITTIDYDKQQKAEQAISENANTLKRANAENAALVSVDPKTGQILDMVGSVDYFNTKIDGNVNVATSLRQPGSSFKVFEYSTLLKQKDYSPSKILFDLQTDFGGGYVPRNYNGNFNGPVTLRYALQNSLNIPAIKALSLAGMDNTIKTAEDLGITTLTDKNKYGLSLALGVAEVRPVEMASAYATLANGGNHQDLTPFLKITNSNGKVLYDFDVNHHSSQVLDPQVAFEMSTILSDNASRTPTFGARSPLYFSDHTVAAKTGTTQENRDGWTCGYTPSLATVVWTGNNMPSPMKTDAVNIAGPIFHSFMTKALAGTPNERFTEPAGIRIVTVDKFSNKLPSDQSTETTTEIFASWQIPTEKDNVHKKVKICKANGLLAPNDLPDALTEEKTFITLHSERPDNPNWENPVRGWAEANGMYSLPPTDYCKSSDLAPKLNFNSPAENSTLSGPSSISATASSSSDIKSMEFFIDDISIGQGTSSAAGTFTITYDFTNLSDGNHKIGAIATDQNGATVNRTISINISKGTSSLTISDPVVSIGSSNTATITWTSNIPSTSVVSYGLDQNNLNLNINSSDFVTDHTVSLKNLTSDKTYYFTITSTDASNTTETSSTKIFTTTKK